MRGRDWFSRFKKLISIFVLFYKLFPTSVRIKLLERHRYTRGIIGIGLRYVILKSVAVSCGDNVYIGQGVYIINPENLCIGNNVSIHPLCYIDCGKNKEQGLIIGNDVSVAHGTTVMDTTHTYTDKKINIKDQELLTIRTEICDNVWIGAKAVIIAGKTVEKGCIIGAGAVLTKSTDENCVYVGVPAKKIKCR